MKVSKTEIEDHFEAVDADALVFTGRLGEELRVRELDHAWRKARLSIGRCRLHFHGLRP